MSLVMRDLRGDDLFTMMAIIGRLEIEDQLIELFENMEMPPVKPIIIGGQSEKAKKKQEEEFLKQQKEREELIKKRGMQVVAGLSRLILQNVNKAKSDINLLLSDLTGKSVADIEGLGLVEYTGLLVGFFKKKELIASVRAAISLLSTEGDTD